MRMGRLAISRGFPSPDEAGEPACLALVEPTGPSAPRAATDAMAAVNARIEVLERLTRLCEAGALTVDEFLAEKAQVLGHPRSNLAGSPDDAPAAAPISFTPAHARPKRGRSLLGRLGWFILPIGLVAGLGLTAVTQPELVAQGWQESLRLLGR